MNEEKLKQKQKEFDEKKYFQSQTARQDLSGLMEYCENCDFRLFSQEQQRLICNLDPKSREENKVCAKNYLRRKENESKKFKSRRTSNGKS